MTDNPFSNNPFFKQSCEICEAYTGTNGQSTQKGWGDNMNTPIMINGRTPEEIKELLANYKNYTFSAEALYADTLAYIQQLERERADNKHFELLRAKTFEGIKKALAIDSHCKSYEGAFEVHHLYTDYFFDAHACAEPETIIRLHCYVLGPARHYEWKGKTFAEALAKAEYDITTWIKQLEVE